MTVKLESSLAYSNTLKACIAAWESQKSSFLTIDPKMGSWMQTSFEIAQEIAGDTLTRNLSRFDALMPLDKEEREEMIDDLEHEIGMSLAADLQAHIHRELKPFLERLKKILEE